MLFMSDPTIHMCSRNGHITAANIFCPVLMSPVNYSFAFLFLADRCAAAIAYIFQRSMCCAFRDLYTFMLLL